MHQEPMFLHVNSFLDNIGCSEQSNRVQNKRQPRGEWYDGRGQCGYLYQNYIYFSFFKVVCVCVCVCVCRY